MEVWRTWRSWIVFRRHSRVLRTTQRCPYTHSTPRSASETDRMTRDTVSPDAPAKNKQSHVTHRFRADRYHPTLGIVIFVLHSLVGWSFHPRTKTSYGDRSFSVHGPSAWNSLPNDLRLSDMSLETFRSRLKAFLFGHWSLGSPFAAVREFGLYK